MPPVTAKRHLQRLRQMLALLQDYFLASLGSPRLFWAALRHVLLRKAAVSEGIFRAARTPLPEAAPVPPLWPDLISALAQEIAVLVIEAKREIGAIGVRGQDLARAVLYLAARARKVEVLVNDQEMDLTGARFDHAMLEARTVLLRFDGPGGLPQELRLEPYFYRREGQWISANIYNQSLRGVYADVFARPGRILAADLLAGPTLADLARARPVDAVYTWVNHADPTWAALYARHIPGSAGLQGDASALSRFHSNDELRYSLRSLAENLPWVRRIYVLSNCAPPDWLDLAQDRLCWIPHETVIPLEYLPTFNSHVIESCLHRIPGLSEQFLYINDDVFIAKSLEKSEFFTDAGASRAFLDPYGMVSGPVVAGEPDYLNAARNSAALIRAALGYVPTQLHQHTVFALRQSVLADIENHWPNEISALRQRKFRSPQDLNIVSFLYHHYGIGTGGAVESHATTAFIKSQDVRWRSQLMQTADNNLETFCINEGGSEAPAWGWHNTVETFLKRRFTQPAQWERA